MAELQPGDNVEWRAGTTPSTFHTRKGVIKEVLPSGLALVRVGVQGKTIVEEIRAARLRKIDLPKPVVEEKTGASKGRKTAAKEKKGAKK
ncbi:MAG: hypothetical protein P8123_00605 [bacterium]|jgi:hypothetical protein